MHLAATKVQIDPVVGEHAEERLGDAEQLGGRRVVDLEASPGSSIAGTPPVDVIGRDLRRSACRDVSLDALHVPVAARHSLIELDRTAFGDPDVAVVVGDRSPEDVERAVGDLAPDLRDEILGTLRDGGTRGGLVDDVCPRLPVIQLGLPRAVEDGLGLREVIGAPVRRERSQPAVRPARRLIHPYPMW